MGSLQTTLLGSKNKDELRVIRAPAIMINQRTPESWDLHGVETQPLGLDQLVVRAYGFVVKGFFGLPWLWPSR